MIRARYVGPGVLNGLDGEATFVDAGVWGFIPDADPEDDGGGSGMYHCRAEDVDLKEGV